MVAMEDLVFGCQIQPADLMQMTPREIFFWHNRGSVWMNRQKQNAT